jgi:protein phosphatase
MQWNGLSNVGSVRANNEDNYYVTDIGDDVALVLVADGVGGNASGEVASKMVSDTFAQLVADNKFAAAIDVPSIRGSLLDVSAHKIHSNVAKESIANPQHKGMATTLTAAIVSDTSLHLLQVGDSRCYCLRAGQLQQLSVDQTVAQSLVSEGKINAADIATHPDRNVLLQCLGLESANNPFEPVLSEFAMQAGDKILLCSDGLTDMANDNAIEKVLTTASNPVDACEQLINIAIAGGGKDNITVVVGYA